SFPAAWTFSRRVSLPQTSKEDVAWPHPRIFANDDRHKASGLLCHPRRTSQVTSNERPSTDRKPHFAFGAPTKSPTLPNTQPTGDFPPLCKSFDVNELGGRDS